MKKVCKVCFLIFVLCKSIVCFGGGTIGHELVVEVARSRVKREILDSVNEYLGKLTWEKASVWMDKMRSDHSSDHMKPRHDINIEKNNTYLKTNFANIINEVYFVIAGLKNMAAIPKERTFQNLKILFHLIDNIHITNDQRS